MGTSKSAPDTPDLNSTINAGYGGNWANTRAINQAGLSGTVSPYGTSSFEFRRNAAGNPIYSKYVDPVTGEKYRSRVRDEVVTQSPGEAEKYRQTTELQNRALGMGNELLSSMGGFNPSTYQPGADLSGEAWSGDPLKLGNEATEARLFELGRKRLDPLAEQRRRELQTSLLNRGVREGSEAWNAATTQNTNAEADAYNQLLLTGRGQATDELSREWQSGLAGNQQRFGQLVGARTLGMGEQAQQFGQEMGKQGSNIQMLSQLLQAGQPNMPQFTGRTATPNPYTDYPGIINTQWDQQFKAWQAEQQAKQSGIGGVLSAGASIIGSDERIKDNIKQVGQTQDGLPIYEFSIGDGEMQTGVMAQDVEKVNPGAVVENAGGVKGVDYPAAVGDGTGTYTVEKGDNIWTIGERLGVDPREIIAANPQLENPDAIFPGDKLVVPGMAAPGPEAVPLAALPAGGPEAVTAALAGPVGPGTAPPGAMPAAAMPAAPAPVSPFAGKFVQPPPVAAPPPSPESIQSGIDQAIDQGLPIQRPVIDQETMRQLLMSGGMGAY